MSTVFRSIGQNNLPGMKKPAWGGPGLPAWWRYSMVRRAMGQPVRTFCHSFSIWISRGLSLRYSASSAAVAGGSRLAGMANGTMLVGRSSLDTAFPLFCGDFDEVFGGFPAAIRQEPAVQRYETINPSLRLRFKAIVSLPT